MSDNHGWQPIETAPRDGTEILAWSEDSGHVVAWVCRGSWVMFEHAIGSYGGIAVEGLTLWQPLPPPLEERRDA